MYVFFNKSTLFLSFFGIFFYYCEVNQLKVKCSTPAGVRKSLIFYSCVDARKKTKTYFVNNDLSWYVKVFDFFGTAELQRPNSIANVRFFQ